MKKINLKEFEKNIVLRKLKESDYESVVALQLKCFPYMKTWSKEQFVSQISIFPEGQICIQFQKKIVASSSSLILDFSLYSEWHSWKDIADSGFIRSHTQNGNTLYGIEIMVDPEYRGFKLARRLCCKKRNCKEAQSNAYDSWRNNSGYNKYSDKLTAREYVDKVVNKILFDPVLTTQISNGFVIKRLIPDYLEKR